MTAAPRPRGPLRALVVLAWLATGCGTVEAAVSRTAPPEAAPAASPEPEQESRDPLADAPPTGPPVCTVSSHCGCWPGGRGVTPACRQAEPIDLVPGATHRVRSGSGEWVALACEERCHDGACFLACDEVVSACTASCEETPPPHHCGPSSGELACVVVPHQRSPTTHAVDPLTPG